MSSPPPPADGIGAPPAPPPPFLPPDEQLRRTLLKDQIKIQGFLFAVFVLYTLILIGGRLRTRGGSKIKTVSTVLFMISGHFVSYIPGLMSSSGQSNHLYVFWFSFVTYLAALANEISSYTLQDNEDRKKRLIVDYFVPMGLVLSFFGDSLATPNIIVPIGFVFWIVILKLRERSHALLYVNKSSNGLSRATKVISDFNVYQEHSGEISNPNSFYKNFLVGVVEAKKMRKNNIRRGSRLIEFDLSKLITLDKVLDPNETFFVSTDAGKDLQNTCISFAMFWTLLAKMAGYKKIDAKIFKGRNNNNNNSTNKVHMNSFDLVEKELEFLYEYLFTNSFAIYDRGLWKKVRDICVISTFFWVTTPLLISYRPEDYNILYVMVWGMVLDVGFTRFIILGIVLVEFFQIGLFLTSKWGKVIYTCWYLRIQAISGGERTTKSNILERVIRAVCHAPRPRIACFCCIKFTERSLNQYTILDCFVAIPHEMWCACWINRYYDVAKIGHGGETSVPLSPELKQSILDGIETCLDQNQGIFTNGVCALKDKVEEEVISNFVTGVSNQARAILIWHIATSLIEGEASKGDYDANNFATATQLSKYCAYVVGFLPNILSDHVATTQREFNEAVKELSMGVFDDDSEDPKAELKRGEFSIMDEAEKLKEKLQQHEANDKWKILAGFWTEMTLFLALSDDPDAIEVHANSLCKGGEFITHLWALATHAGCSKKLIKA